MDRCKNCGKILNDRKLTVNLEMRHHYSETECDTLITCNDIAFCDTQCFIDYLNSDKHLD